MIEEEASEGGLPQSIQSHGGLPRQSGRPSQLPTAFPGDLLPLARGSISQEIFGGCISGPWRPLPAVEVCVSGLASVCTRRVKGDGGWKAKGLLSERGTIPTLEWGTVMQPAHAPPPPHRACSTAHPPSRARSQAVRDDGCPVPHELLTDLDDPSKVEARFEDVIRGKRRVGVVSFTAPAYYHFRVQGPDGAWKKGLTIPLVPIRPGATRIFIVRKFPPQIPTWLLHSFSNRSGGAACGVAMGPWPAMRRKGRGLGGGPRGG